MKRFTATVSIAGDVTITIRATDRDRVTEEIELAANDLRARLQDIINLPDRATVKHAREGYKILRQIENAIRGAA